jgi:hypothetical protein
MAPGNRFFLDSGGQYLKMAIAGEGLRENG